MWDLVANPKSECSAHTGKSNVYFFAYCSTPKGKSRVKTENKDNFEFSVCFFPKRKHAGNTYKLVMSMNFRGVGPFFQSWIWKAAIGDRKGSLETAWAGCSPKCEPTGTGLSVRHCAFVLQEAFLSPGQACVLLISLQVGLPPCFLTVSCPNTGVRLWCQKTPFAAKAKNWGLGRCCRGFTQEMQIQFKDFSKKWTRATWRQGLLSNNWKDHSQEVCNSLQNKYF